MISSSAPATTEFLVWHRSCNWPVRLYRLELKLGKCNNIRSQISLRVSLPRAMGSYVYVLVRA